VPPENEVVTLPPVPKDASRCPEASYCARASWNADPMKARPTATRRPLGRRRRAEATSSCPPKSVVTLPPEPNEASSAPDAEYRTRAKSDPVPGDATWAEPATTIFPSGWSATDVALSAAPRTAVVTFPPVPNEGSRIPEAS
jgi:hypothetical protein